MLVPFLLFCFPAIGSRLVFEPPISLGTPVGFGIQATLALNENVFAAAIGLENTTSTDTTQVLAITNDGGKTFTKAKYPAGFSLPEWPTVVAKGGAVSHDFGNISHVEPKTTRPTYFNFSAATVNTYTFQTAAGTEAAALGSDGAAAVTRLGWMQKKTEVFFGGLPFAAGDELYTRAPFRLQGGGQVTLDDGSLLHSGSVWFPECQPSCLPIPPSPPAHVSEFDQTFAGQERGRASAIRSSSSSLNKTNCCPGNTASTHGTSSLAFRSTDGLQWEYLATIVDARNIPTSEEGCSEHDLVKLKNGNIVMICRTDGGDGEETHKSSNYVQTVSTDQGKTWSYPRYINAGSARPRLLRTVASASNDTEVLIMAGGRWGTPGAYAHNCPITAKPCDWRRANRSMEPTIFLDAGGSEGLEWEPYSISYWHNTLATASTPALFTPRINNTWEESTAYTSIVGCGPGCAVLFYDVAANGANVFEKNATKYGFAMRMHLE